MGLDFHLAKTENEAPYTRALCSFELQPHTLLFGRAGLPQGQFPLIDRLRNYFEDATFSTEELDALVQEVNRIKSQFSINENVVQHMDAILCICTKAKSEQLGIWVYCD
jgi:hypothetical protein